MTEQAKQPSAWDAAQVGLTARCDKHLDEGDQWTLMICPECQVKCLARAREDFRRQHQQSPIEAGRKVQ